MKFTGGDRFILPYGYQNVKFQSFDLVHLELFSRVQKTDRKLLKSAWLFKDNNYLLVLIIPENVTEYSGLMSSNLHTYNLFHQNFIP